MKKTIALILAMVMCFGLLAACGSKDTGSAGGEATNTGSSGSNTTIPTTAVTNKADGEVGTVDKTVKYRDTVRLSMPSEVASGRFLTFTAGGAYYDMGWEALTVQNAATGEVESELAESWKDVNGDGTAWEFKLYENIRFHRFDEDYAPLTASDVKWTYEYTAPGGPGVQEGVVLRTATPMTLIDHIETTGDYIVTFYLKSPVFDFPYQISGVNIMSEKAMEEFGHLDGQEFGTGPYYINHDETRSGQYWTWTRYDDYWRGIDIYGTKNIQFIIHPEQTTGVAALLAGEVDGIPGIKAENALQFQGNSDYKFYNISGTSPATIFFNSYDGTGFFDGEDDPDQIKLRQAIKLAIDRDSLCAILYAANPAAGDRKDSLFNTEGGTGVVDFGEAEFNVEKARTMMNELGYNENNRLALKLIHYASYTNYAQIVQDQLKNIYIDLEVAQVDASSIGTVLRTGEGWDMAVNYYGPGTTLSNCMLVNLHSTGSNARVYGWNSAEMDKRIDNVLAQTTLESQLAAYAEFQEWANNYVPRIPTHAGNTINLMVAEVEGFVASAFRTDYCTIRIPE